AERAPDFHPVDHSGRRARSPDLGGGIRWTGAVRREIRLLSENLRHARGCDPVPRLAVGVEPGAAARRRAQLRARARPRARCGVAGRERHPASAARRAILLSRWYGRVRRRRQRNYTRAGRFYGGYRTRGETTRQ